MKILKTIMISAALLFTITACTLGSATETPGIAKVVTTNGSGSAFQIKDGVWLTAAHVTTKEKTVELELPDGRKMKAEVKWSDETRDVAMLIAPKGMKIEVVPLACAIPAQGQAVTHRGFPLGWTYFISQGRVATDVFNRLELPSMWSDIQVTVLTAAPGSSGGIIQAHGYAVGMVVGGHPQFSTMVITLTGKYLCDTIKKHEEQTNGS